MCGICGEISFNGSPASPAAVGAMSGCMIGRGPDSAGLFAQGATALGHRRLKIIDTTERAQQPMIDNELGLAIIYNGAIYNYPELRKQLQDKGYRFFSTGDTEVILKAYHAWGPACVERLNGMFAFAIRQRDSGELFLARDRLGIKPLYYAQSPGRFRFASSLPALLAGDEDRSIDRSIDPVALHHYMSFHSVVPAPHTILKGVRKMPPATRMTVLPDGTQRLDTYWAPDFTPHPESSKRTVAQWKEMLLHELKAAVDRRMIADVPVGVLLSGGLDSSLVVGLLAQAGQKGLNTFSIGFESIDSEAGDEFEYSDIIAKHYGTQHHKIRIDAQQTLENLPGCIAAMSEPMVSHDCIGFYLLSHEVSKHVKVVQSGQGADEIFAGYHWYPPMMQTDDAAAQYARVFFDRPHSEFAQAVNPELVGEDYSKAFIEAHFAQPGADRPIDQTLRLDTTVMLIDDPVKRVDNMTMAWGLEARVPFLDHELVEFAGRIPAELKVGQVAGDGSATGKHILKELGREIIPSEVIDRPKGYFPVPALKYLRGPYFEMVQDALTSQRARQRGIFQEEYLKKLLDRPEAEEHITPLRGSKLWQVALMELWLQKQGL